MEDNTDMRDSLLMELIDKMHDRLAEKEYPSEKPKEAELIEAVKEEPKSEEVSKEEAESPEDMELEAELIKTHLE